MYILHIIVQQIIEKESLSACSTYVFLEREDYFFLFAKVIEYGALNIHFFSFTSILLLLRSTQNQELE